MRRFRGANHQLVLIAIAPLGTGQLEPAPARVDAERGVGGEPRLDRLHDRLQLAVQAGDEHLRVGRQAEGGVVVQALGFPGDARDQVVVEVGPAV